MPKLFVIVEGGCVRSIIADGVVVAATVVDLDLSDFSSAEERAEHRDRELMADALTALVAVGELTAIY